MAQRRASTSPAPRAATSSAVRPTLKAASPKETELGRPWRERCVDVSCAGTHTTTVGVVASGTRTTRPAAVATNPP